MRFKKGHKPWITGKHLSEKTKQKISKSHQGKKSSEELKRKLSEAQKKAWANPELRKKQSDAHKGQKSWNKGKTGLQIAWNKGVSPSKESRIKMSETRKRLYSEGKLISPMKGKHPTSETIRKQKETLRKTLISHPEIRKKISDGVKKAMSNPEVRKRMSEIHKGQVAWNKGMIGWGTGRKLSPESKIKISKALKGKIRSKETREAHSNFMKNYYKTHKSPMFGKKGIPAWNKGIPMREESKLKVSIHNWQKGKPAWNRGKQQSEEAKRKMSKFQKEEMSKPERKEHSRKTILRLYESGLFPKQENTKPERQLKEELIKRGYVEGTNFIHQYKFMNKFMCDFSFPQQKLIIEVDGDFWHANPKKYPNQNKLHPHQIRGIGRDKSKNAYITEVDNGSWNLLRFWESDIKKDVVKCVDKIEETLKEKKR